MTGAAALALFTFVAAAVVATVAGFVASLLFLALADAVAKACASCRQRCGARCASRKSCTPQELCAARTPCSPGEQGVAPEPVLPVDTDAPHALCALREPRAAHEPKPSRPAQRRSLRKDEALSQFDASGGMTSGTTSASDGCGTPSGGASSSALSASSSESALNGLVTLRWRRRVRASTIPELLHPGCGGSEAKDAAAARSHCSHAPWALDDFPEAPPPGAEDIDSCRMDSATCSLYDSDGQSVKSSILPVEVEYAPHPDSVKERRRRNPAVGALTPLPPLPPPALRYVIKNTFVTVLDEDDDEDVEYLECNGGTSQRLNRRWSDPVLSRRTKLDAPQRDANAGVLAVTNVAAETAASRARADPIGRQGGVGTPPVGAASGCRADLRDSQQLWYGRAIPGHEGRGHRQKRCRRPDASARRLQGSWREPQPTAQDEKVRRGDTIAANGPRAGRPEPSVCWADAAEEDGWLGCQLEPSANSADAAEANGSRGCEQDSASHEIASSRSSRKPKPAASASKMVGASKMAGLGWTPTLRNTLR
mmetsp:Transcript_31230/g.85711  ORF Transcript_31230/g.85711 Transcript_31230/m.85711 type:complete len:539 (+) Transcript_31230:64-1680(+)